MWAKQKTFPEPIVLSLNAFKFFAVPFLTVFYGKHFFDQPQAQRPLSAATITCVLLFIHLHQQWFNNIIITNIEFN